jgi:hypothetical protein
VVAIVDSLEGAAIAGAYLGDQPLIVGDAQGATRQRKP